MVAERDNNAKITGVLATVWSKLIAADCANVENASRARQNRLFLWLGTGFVWLRLYQ